MLLYVGCITLVCSSDFGKKSVVSEHSIIPLQANVFNSPDVLAVINYLKARHNDKIKQFEADYSRLSSMILPYYFEYHRGWYISPEQWWGENHHPDYSVSKVDLKDEIEQGRALPYLFWELKRSNEDDDFKGDPDPVKDGKFTKKPVKVTTKYSWKQILNQMWNQCDAANMETNGNGKMWAIGQRGFEICFFKFDLLEFEDSIYTNFEPLNLEGWPIYLFNVFEIALETEILENREEIRVIRWRLDNPLHHIYIHNMFMFVLGHPLKDN